MDDEDRGGQLGDGVGGTVVPLLNAIWDADHGLRNGGGGGIGGQGAGEEEGNDDRDGEEEEEDEEEEDDEEELLIFLSPGMFQNRGDARRLEWLFSPEEATSLHMHSQSDFYSYQRVAFL